MVKLYNTPHLPQSYVTTIARQTGNCHILDCELSIVGIQIYSTEKKKNQFTFIMRFWLQTLPGGELLEVVVSSGITVWQLRHHLTRYFWDGVHANDVYLLVDHVLLSDDAVVRDVVPWGCVIVITVSTGYLRYR